MKLLLDQNLSHRLAAAFRERFPGTAHLRHFGLDRVDDDAAWAFARRHSFAIMSKDDDFHQRGLLPGHPPMVVWLAPGNSSTDAIRDAVLAAADEILAFGEDAEQSVMIIRSSGSLRY